MISKPLNRNPTWHGLTDGKMPPFPVAIVRDVLARFEIENPVKLEAWPFGPFDILTAFEYRNTPYLLKGRHVEQRGVKSLFQTQDIQKQLLRLGFPVSDFLANTSGETLVKGPDWQNEGNIFYEIQSILSGVPFSSDTHTASLAGKLLGQLHFLGQEIHSDLLSKFYYIDTFVDRFLALKSSPCFLTRQRSLILAFFKKRKRLLPEHNASGIKLKKRRQKDAREHVRLLPECMSVSVISDTIMLR